ncbi:MAG: DUF3467 domain-containing protein [Bacteroidales bacterium]|nr:DUF3467 domain-containing protein [Bacteroidales bacterium]
MEENKPQSLSLEIRPEVARGSYSNLAIISHSKSEVIVDFATMLPGLKTPDVTNRIVMTPENAKRLLNALMDNITKYEQQFGFINLGNVPEFNGGNGMRS